MAVSLGARRCCATDMALAFVFPGQGSQSVGMLGGLAEAYPQVRETFAEASSILGRDLWQLVQQGPEQELNQTQNTQPAMLVAGVAVWRVWRACQGPLPQHLAGHSLGEYTALVCGGSLEFSDAVRLVADRGRFMQAAVPPGQGAMAAVLGLSPEDVQRLCDQAAQGQVLAPVNFNSPEQIVIAGSAKAVERAVAMAKDFGAKRAVQLPVSVPSHCALMRPAAESMAARLQQAPVRAPQIPVWHNVHVQTEAQPEAIRAALVQQIHSPVRWVQTIEKMAEKGVQKLIECGPGKVLTGLNKRIAPATTTLPVFDKKTLEEALAAVSAGI